MHSSRRTATPRPRASVSLCLLAVLCVSLIRVADAQPGGPAAEANGGVHLPGIFNAMRTPETDSLSPNTIDQVAQCMGGDADIRGQAAKLQQEHEALDAEHKDLGRQFAALDSTGKAIRTDKANLAQGFAGVEAANKDLDKDSGELDTLRKKATTADAIAKFNSRVKAHNAKVGEIKKRAEHLQAAQSSLNARIDKFNAQSHELQRRIQDFNDRIADHNNRNAKFKELIATYQAKCTGEHRTSDSPE